jgi:transcriptional regulator with XRE-family HTH domain
MNQALAENIRTLRETRSWTQEQLAEAAQLNPRTVQRAEAAQGASAETLLAIAGALDVDVELLRFDAMEFLAQHLGVPREALTPEFLAQKQSEIATTHTTLTMTRVHASADLRPLGDTMSMVFECLWTNDDVQDVAAQLHRDLNDVLDIGSELDPVTRREWEVGAFEHVHRLNKLGAVVTVGLHRHRLVVADKEPMPWTTLYVIVSKEHEAKDYLLIPKRRPVKFT